MPKNSDIKNVLIIGSGPIVVGQGCEFDYAGVQACKALKEEGLKVVLINSNPATIMTDPKLADATYIEPLNSEVIEKIIKIENIDSILTTMGGQTAINLSLELSNKGILDKHNVKLIGANKDVMLKAEDRSIFYMLLKKNSIDCPEASIAKNREEAVLAGKKMGYPLLIRSSFSLAGKGVFLANSSDELIKAAQSFFSQNPAGTLLIEESVVNWKEFELEVVRDSSDNCILICSIENCDPMGVHTGDSITVAPALTLTDKQLQKMRSTAFDVMRIIGVETGGANVQFAVNPRTGRTVVIEMNPRVSRSSALASKATGFPIAKIATKLAIGYTLDELENEITRTTPASFEPSLDYVVTKIPRFDFEKFPGSNHTLGTTMKSVGEVMGVGKNFEESLNKALCSMEKDYDGLDSNLKMENVPLKTLLEIPSEKRIFYIGLAIRNGVSIQKISKLTGWDKWFIERIANIISIENELLASNKKTKNNPILLRKAKAYGFTNKKIAELTGIDSQRIKNKLTEFDIHPIYRRIDSCAGEFSTVTRYLYSTYLHNESSVNSCEALPTSHTKVIIVGSGPNHIGQGIEFDYCCVHASLAVRERGFESIMINSNPETVSTDHTISDRLYFSPITEEHVIEIIKNESKNGKILGVILQCGGQASLKLAASLKYHHILILGTSFENIELAENRSYCRGLLSQLNLSQPKNLICNTVEEFLDASLTLDLPLIVKPSHIIGGDKMEIIEHKNPKYLKDRFKAYTNKLPLLLEEFLCGAVEVDVDLLSDGKDVHIAGIIEHFEPAGVHSGDSKSIFPSQSIEETTYQRLSHVAEKIAVSLKAVGFLNIQFAIRNDKIYVIEINPRASRTIPFLCKASNKPFAQIGAHLLLGSTIKEYQAILNSSSPERVSIKTPIFSHGSLEANDVVLSPSMKSTGEAMWIGKSVEAVCDKAFRQSFFSALFSSAYVALDFDKEHANLANILEKLLEKRDIKVNAYQNTSDHSEYLAKICADMDQKICNVYLSTKSDTCRRFKIREGTFIATSYFEVCILKTILTSKLNHFDVFPIQTLKNSPEKAIYQNRIS